MQRGKAVPIRNAPSFPDENAVLRSGSNRANRSSVGHPRLEKQRLLHFLHFLHFLHRRATQPSVRLGFLRQDPSVKWNLGSKRRVCEVPRSTESLRVGMHPGRGPAQVSTGRRPRFKTDGLFTCKQISKCAKFPRRYCRHKKDVPDSFCGIQCDRERCVKERAAVVSCPVSSFFLGARWFSGLR